ncbi:hypothetical protein MMC09_003576 [Bachmanniomyces sp. S44760]|nr:hypothetical protein [Bachmanniomyces sp. S44760]
MPAPLAKGLIVSISILIAAGIAIYDNPQVQEWVVNSRRKLAFALHNLGDEIHPQSPEEDASTREDESHEATERRRQARAEILERGRLLENRRRAKQGQPPRGKSFDDLVDDQGILKQDVSGEAQTTAIEPQAADDGVRNRAQEARGVAMGTFMANPFSDEMSMEQISKPDQPLIPAQENNETSILLPSTSQTAEQSRSPADAEELSNHPSEQLVDLTPTTSNSPSNISSSHAEDLSELSRSGFHSLSAAAEAYPPGQTSPSPVHHQPQTSGYRSIDEWAESSNVSFYSPPSSISSPNSPQPQNAFQTPTLEETEDNRSDAGTETQRSRTVSEVGSGEDVGRASQQGEESDMDVMSESSVGNRDGVSTPGSWTEVGSVVSEDF